MKVLIIPEDQTQDGFIAKPIVEAIFKDLEVKARVDVLPEPRLRGADDALGQELLQRIAAQNPMVDLFVLIVDRDCDRRGHVARARAREEEHHDHLLACVAIEEIEVWMLALYREELAGVSWNDVRSECDPKERWAEPLLDRIGTKGPGRGRKRAMEALKGRLRPLLTVCEELSDLRSRIAAFVRRSGE